jgi:putative mRNA 3-end processing factor
MGEVDISFVPAGHVLGSAQIVLEHGGERVVVSGDYKRRADPTCAPFEPVPCDIFITEATFGLPSSATPTPGARWTGCWSGSTPIRIAACSSAPMRSARRSG